jgi:hypothetical protein
METALLIALSGLGTAAIALRRKAATVKQDKTKQKFTNAAVAIEAAQKAIQEILASGDLK